MILQFLIGLIALSVSSLMITQGRRRRIWSIFLLVGLGAVIYYFILNIHSSPAQGFIYQWLPYDLIKANLNISASVRTQNLISSLSILLIAFVYLNTIYKEEKHPLHANTLLLINFIGLILLVSSHDFFQMMFADCVISLVSFYFIEWSQGRKNLFIFNFVAEMILFAVLAIVYGETGSISLSKLDIFIKSEGYKDFVAYMLIVSLGMKCGLFLTNGQYFSLKDVLFNRLGILMTLTIPFSGIIIASKLSPLVQTVPLGNKFCFYWCFLSYIIAFLSAFVSKDTKTKVISLSLGVYAYTLQQTLNMPEIMYSLMPNFLELIGLMFVLFIIAEKGTSLENNVVKLGGFWRYTKFNFILSLVILVSIILLFQSITTTSNDVIFSAVLVSVLAATIKLIYLGKSRADEKLIGFASNVGILYWGPLLMCVGAIVWHTKADIDIRFYKLIIISAIFLGMIPSRFLIKINRLSINLQEILLKLYEIVFLLPLRVLGRILWLMFDVVMIERNIVGSVSAIALLVVNGLHYVQKTNLKQILCGFVLGIGILAIYFWRYIYE